MLKQRNLPESSTTSLQLAEAAPRLKEEALNVLTKQGRGSRRDSAVVAYVVPEEMTMSDSPMRNRSKWGEEMAAMPFECLNFADSALNT